MDTISLFDAGFKLAGAPIPEPVTALSPCKVQEKHGFKFSHILDFEDDKLITLTPKALRVDRELCTSALEMVANVRSVKKYQVDQRLYGHFQWKYDPVALTMEQENIFFDLIKAVQSAGSLPCVTRGFLPESGPVEITPYSVLLLLDTKISREAYETYKARFPRAVKAEAQDNAARQNIQDKKALVESETSGTTTGMVNKLQGAVKTETVKAEPQTKAEQIAAAKAFVNDGLREDANSIWADIMKYRNPQQIHKAVDAAISYINAHPTSKFKDVDLSPEILRYDKSCPRRAIFRGVQSVLKRNGYKHKNGNSILGMDKIKRLLSKR